MNTDGITRCISILAFLFAAGASAATFRVFTDAETDNIKAFLHDNFANTNAGMVIGLLDEHGSRIFGAGKPDNGTDGEVNGDTIFEIGSITKTFTALLAFTMDERGELKLKEPAARYLPASVKVPSHGGKEITLLNLAAQDSGLPFNAENLSGGYDAYTAEKMYAFLATYVLTNDPGTKFQYSNLGMSLLGHVMERVAHTNFESLVVDRICRPLQMDDTRVTLTPEQKARAATGHEESGKPAPDYHLQVMTGAGALRSTASDLLKYVSANLGLTRSALTPLMNKMQVIRHTDSAEMGKTAMPWYDQAVYYPASQLLGHGGGTLGSSTFIGFDRQQCRGVVVLSNQKEIHASTVGWTILQCQPLTRESGSQFAQEWVGIGTALGLDQQTRLLKITRVFPNSPAANAGLRAGLLIQKIDAIFTAGKSTTDCAGLIRGPAGTTVQLELIDLERKETNTVKVIRQKFVASK